MSQAETTSKSYILMVVVAVISGVLSAFTNVALAYGGDIMGRVREAGAAPQWAPFAVMPIALLDGSLVNLADAFLHLSRNKTWGNFGGDPREILNPVLAGRMWMGGIALYSIATTYRGVLGVSIGFALVYDHLDTLRSGRGSVHRGTAPYTGQDLWHVRNWCDASLLGCCAIRGC